MPGGAKGVIGDIPPKPIDRAGFGTLGVTVGPAGVVDMATGGVAPAGRCLVGIGVELAIWFLRSVGGGASGIVLDVRPERSGFVALPRRP